MREMPGSGLPMTTIATGNRRLLKLADLLDALPRERFDYTQWVEFALTYEETQKIRAFIKARAGR